MFEKLRDYYEDELSFLRSMGDEFAAAFPRIAGRLGIAANQNQCSDPHVERLLQGVALLTGRIQKRLDDELPEFTQPFLDLLYPHLLAPVPSLSMVQFRHRPEMGKLESGYEVPTGTILDSEPVDGEPCTFRTCYAVTVWPIEVALVGFNTRPIPSGRKSASDAPVQSTLQIVFKTHERIPLRKLGISSLRLHLTGEGIVANGLYELFMRSVSRIGAGTGRKPAQSLPVSAIRKHGYEIDQGLFPYPRRSFLGYRLLHEYFALPEKFLFVDIGGLDVLEYGEDDDTLTLTFEFTARPRFPQKPEAENFRLGCTPIANLFEVDCEPLDVVPYRHEYEVIPRRNRPRHFEVSSILSVRSHDPRTQQTREYLPFYGFRQSAMDQTADVYWHAVRRSDQTSDDAPTEIWLSFVDTGFEDAEPTGRTLSVRTLCSNANVPSRLQPSTTADDMRFTSEGLSPAIGIVCLARPTKTHRGFIGRRAQWPLISHLNLNFLSLVDPAAAAPVPEGDPESGPQAGGPDGVRPAPGEVLRGLLALYAPEGDTAAQTQIGGVRAVDSRPALHVSDGLLLRGLDIRVDLDSENFAGTTPIVLSFVLDHFLGLYCTLNSFIRLTVWLSGQDSPYLECPARSGSQELI